MEELYKFRKKMNEEDSNVPKIVVTHERQVYYATDIVEIDREAFEDYNEDFESYEEFVEAYENGDTQKISSGLDLQEIVIDTGYTKEKDISFTWDVDLQ